MRTKNTSPKKQAVDKKSPGKKLPQRKRKNGKEEEVTNKKKKGEEEDTNEKKKKPDPEYRIKASLLDDQHDTLQEFLNRYMAQIYALRRKLKYEEVRLVCWKYDGPERLRMPQRYQELIQTILSSSKPFYAHGTNETEKPKELAGSLGDHLFFFCDRLPSVIENLRFVDPVGDGNCGYYTLQLIGMFLYLEEAPPELFDEAVMHTKKMRQYVKDKLLQDIEFYRTSKGMLLSFRPDDISDQDWENGGLGTFGVCHMEDLVISNQDQPDSLLNGVSLKTNIISHDVSPYFEMDQRHLEVFARTTKTRIVFLKYSIENDSFVRFEYDWRTSPEKCFYSEVIPTFDKDYDFYRTAVVTHSRTSKRIEDEEIVFSNSMFHFALWIPDEYAKRIHENKRIQPSNESQTVPTKNQASDEPSSPKVGRKKQSLVEPSKASDEPSPRVPRKKQSLVETSNESQTVRTKNQASDEPSPKVPRKKQSLVESSKVKKVTTTDVAANPQNKREQKDAGKKDEVSKHNTEETKEEETKEETVPEVDKCMDEAGKKDEVSEHNTEERKEERVPEVHNFIDDYGKEDYDGEYKDEGGLDGIVVPTMMMENITQESYQPPKDIFEDIVLDLPAGNEASTARNADRWHNDTAKYEYEGSSEWLLADWFTKGANFKLWMNPGKRKKKDIQAELSDMINTDGLENHRIHRNRNNKLVGEHINRMFREMKRVHKKIQVETKKGSTVEECEVISQTVRYYNLLYPTMKTYLMEEWTNDTCKKAATLSNQHSTSEVKPEYSVELKDQEKLEKVSDEARRHNEVMEGLERQRKEMEIKELQSDMQFKRMERFMGYRQQKFSWKAIARFEPALIVFFPEEELSDKEKKDYEEEYNKWLRLNNRVADFKF